MHLTSPVSRVPSSVAAPRRRPGRRFADGFTLVELLVVIGIIALLISILLPSLSKAREQARDVQCKSNMSQLYKACLMFANDNKGRLARGPLVNETFTTDPQIEYTTAWCMDPTAASTGSGGIADLTH